MSNLKATQNLILELWNNPESQEYFLAEPRTYLEQSGQEIPDDVKVVAHADAPGLRHFVLPSNETEVVDSPDPITQIIGRAVRDAAFKSELLDNPKSAAAEMGVTIPEDMEVRVLENSQDELHLILPMNPSNSELSDADLEAVVGGKGPTNEEEKAICTGSGGGAVVGCAVTAFSTPVAGVVSGVSAGSATIASAVASSS